MVSRALVRGPGGERRVPAQIAHRPGARRRRRHRANDETRAPRKKESHL